MNLPEGSAFCPACGNKVAEIPVAPVAPVVPVEPVAPVAPVVPVEPVAPVAPVAPVEPVAPVAPVAPVEPVAPVAPVAPVEPVAPVAPVAAPAAPKKKSMAWLYILIGVLVVAIAAAALYFTGVFGDDDDDDDDDDTKPSISQNVNIAPVGTWTYQGVTLTLSQDGTGTMYGEAITWELMDAQSLRLIRGSGDDVVLTFAINGDTVSFTDEDGDTTVWTKVTDNDNNGSFITTAPTYTEGKDAMDTNPSGAYDEPITTAPTYNYPTYTTGAYQEPTTTDQPEVMAPSAGYITNDGYGNDIYYNRWANMMYGIDDTWTEGTEDEYASFENRTTACGLYLKRTTNGVNSHVLTISFEMLTGNNTSITVEQYMANVCQGLISSYSAAGVTYEVGDLKTLRMCGETWSDFTVSLNNGQAYQRCIARRQDNCVILVSLTALSESELNSMLYNFTTID